MEIRTVIVDDDKINLAFVKKIVNDYFPNITIVGQASNVKEAIMTINNLSPELLVLDINLGKDEVFEIFDEIDVTSKIVFMSSEGKYALKTLYYNAIDFVLKPIKKDKLVDAITEAIAQLEKERWQSFSLELEKSKLLEPNF